MRGWLYIAIIDEAKLWWKLNPNPYKEKQAVKVLNYQDVIWIYIHNQYYMFDHAILSCSVENNANWLYFSSIIPRPTPF